MTKRLLSRLWRFLVPHFEVDEWAVLNMGWFQRPIPVCSMRSVGPDEEFHGIVLVRSISWLGGWYFLRQTGPVRPFVNPHLGAV